MNEYPILGKNTTQDDLDEALYVLQQDDCTRFDLELYLLGGEDPEWNDTIPTDGPV